MLLLLGTALLLLGVMLLLLGALLTTSGPPVQSTDIREPPQFASAITREYVVATVGLFQVGALIQVTLLLAIIVAPQRTTGGVIAVPTVPVVGKPVQVSSAGLIKSRPSQFAD
jgi:hypothetical protein